MIKRSKTPLASVQTNPSDSERKVLSPYEVYLRFERKQGEKVLTEQEYNKIIRDRKAAKTNKDAKS